MEGLKGGQELGSNLTVCVCVLCCSVKSPSPFDGGSASPFIEEGASFYKGEGFRMRTLLSLVAHVYPTWFFILMSAKEDKRLQYCRCLCRMSGWLQNAALHRVWVAARWFDL